MALGVCKAPQGTVHYGEVASYFFKNGSGSVKVSRKNNK